MKNWDSLVFVGRKGCTLGWERGTKAITQRNNMAALEDKAIWEDGEVFFTFMAVSKSFLFTLIVLKTFNDLFEICFVIL